MALRNADSLETFRRVEAVVRMLAHGWRVPNVVQTISGSWGITSRQAYYYCRKARAQLELLAKERMANALERGVADRNELRREAHEAGDRRLVLDVLKDEAALLGLYAPTKIAPTTPDGASEYSGLSDTQLNRELAAIFAAASASVARGAPDEVAAPCPS